MEAEVARDQDADPPCCPGLAPACSSAASAFTEHQAMLRCYSRTRKETKLSTKCGTGAILTAFEYFTSSFQSGQAGSAGQDDRRWNFPGAAQTCLGRRNAHKTRHAALPIVCLHSPSRCRQLLMLLSEFNVTFF